MDSFSRDKDKHKRKPFDFFELDDEDFERIFRVIRRMMERAYRCRFNQIETGKPFVHSFIINIGPNGKPSIQEFRNCPLKKPNGKLAISEERESLTDIIESDNEVSVTVELPGVEKKDIKLKATKEILEINIDTPQRKYHELVNLPCNVQPRTIKATYKNGVLDVVIKRKEKRRERARYNRK